MRVSIERSDSPCGTRLGVRHDPPTATIALLWLLPSSGPSRCAKGAPLASLCGGRTAATPLLLGHQPHALRVMRRNVLELAFWSFKILLMILRLACADDGANRWTTRCHASRPFCSEGLSTMECVSLPALMNRLAYMCCTSVAAPATLLAWGTTAGALASCPSAHSSRTLNLSSFAPATNLSPRPHCFKFALLVSLSGTTF